MISLEPGVGLQQIEADAQQAVDRRLQHDSAHHRRHGRGRRRVRFRQPDVQRQEAGLGAEAEDGEQEGHARPGAGRVEGAHRGEGVIALRPGQHAEGEQDGDRADVRDQQVEVAGAADFGVAVLGDDEEVRGQRHRLPGDHEGVAVVGDEDADHAREEEVVEQAVQAGRGAFARAKVAGGVDRDAGASGAEEQQEEGRERVDAHVEGDRRHHDDHREDGHGDQQHHARAEPSLHPPSRSTPHGRAASHLEPIMRYLLQ